MDSNHWSEVREVPQGARSGGTDSDNPWSEAIAAIGSFVTQTPRARRPRQRAPPGAGRDDDPWSEPLAKSRAGCKRTTDTLKTAAIPVGDEDPWSEVRGGRGADCSGVQASDAKKVRRAKVEAASLHLTKENISLAAGCSQRDPQSRNRAPSDQVAVRSRIGT